MLIITSFSTGIVKGMTRTLLKGLGYGGSKANWIGIGFD